MMNRNGAYLAVHLNRRSGPSEGTPAVPAAWRQPGISAAIGPTTKIAHLILVDWPTSRLIECHDLKRVPR